MTFGLRPTSDSVLIPTECRSRFPFHKPEAAGCGHLAGGVTDTILETLVKVGD